MHSHRQRLTCILRLHSWHRVRDPDFDWRPMYLLPTYTTEIPTTSRQPMDKTPRHASPGHAWAHIRRSSSRTNKQRWRRRRRSSAKIARFGSSSLGQRRGGIRHDHQHHHKYTSRSPRTEPRRPHLPSAVEREHDGIGGASAPIPHHQDIRSRFVGPSIMVWPILARKIVARQPNLCAAHG